MGVSGCGKTAVGTLLANRLSATFIDGDDLHPPENVRKMAAGIALDDGDRRPWLDQIAEKLSASRQSGGTLVVACSALRESYRERLRRGDPALHLVWLHGPSDLLRERLAGRSGHYMPPALLDSQLATLEPPHDALHIDITPPPAELVAEITTRLGA